LNSVLTCLVGWNWFGAQQISIRIPVACVRFSLFQNYNL